MNKQELLEKIQLAVDDLAINGISDIDMYVAGSATLSLRDFDFRTTMDIDLAISVGERVREIIKKYNINDDMATATDPNISDDFFFAKDASDLLVEKNGIRVYLIWAEFVLILKGFYSDREKDIEDVNNMIGKVDATRIDKSLELIYKSRERNGQIEPFKKEFENIANKLKGGK